MEWQTHQQIANSTSEYDGLKAHIKMQGWKPLIITITIKDG